MNKPTPDELVRRVQALEAAVDQMLGALKADLAALRADLVRLKTSEAASQATASPAPAPAPARSPSAEQPRVGSASFSAQPTRKISNPSGHALKEESIAPRKKDPRSDE